MAHVGVQRLGAGDPQTTAARRTKNAVGEMVGQETTGVGRRQTARAMEGAGDTGHAQRPMVTKQTIITGRKSRTTAAVPKRLHENSDTMMATVTARPVRAATGTTLMPATRTAPRSPVV